MFERKIGTLCADCKTHTLANVFENIIDIFFKCMWTSYCTYWCDKGNLRQASFILAQNSRVQSNMVRRVMAARSWGSCLHYIHSQEPEWDEDCCPMAFLFSLDHGMVCSHSRGIFLPFWLFDFLFLFCFLRHGHMKEQWVFWNSV